jgi:predicted RNase H-like nuclease (RuvC/YqgF family)
MFTFRSQVQALSNSVKAQGKDHSNENLRKFQREAAKLKDQMFKQKKDYEQKLSSIKKRWRLELEGYKQECSLKDKEINRLNKEISKFKKKTKDLNQSAIKNRSVLKCKE